MAGGAFDDFVLGQMLMKFGLDLSDVMVDLTKAERAILPQVKDFSRKMAQALASGDTRAAFVLLTSQTKNVSDLTAKLVQHYAQLGVAGDAAYTLISSGAVKANKALELSAVAMTKAREAAERMAKQKQQLFAKEQLGLQVAANVPNVVAEKKAQEAKRKADAEFNQWYQNELVKERTLNKAHGAALIENQQRDAAARKKAYAERKADILGAFKADDEAKKRELDMDRAHAMALEENRRRDRTAAQKDMALERQMLSARAQMERDFASRQRQQLENQRESIQQMRRVMYDMRGIGIGLTAAVTAPVLGLSMAAVKVSGDFRVAENSIRRMMGSVELGNETMAKLVQFALKSPLDFKETIQGARRLLIMKAGGEDLIRTLRVLTDTMAATGGDEATFKRTIKAFTDVQNRGYLATQEINQFTNANINATEIIAKGLGITVPQVLEKIKDKSIDAKTAIKLLTDGLEEQFGGEGKNRLTEVPGQIQMMKDEWTLALKAMGDALEPATKKAVAFGIEGARSAKKFAEELRQAPKELQLIALGMVGVATAVGPTLTLMSQFGLAAIGVKELALLATGGTFKWVDALSKLTGVFQKLMPFLRFGLWAGVAYGIYKSGEFLMEHGEKGDTETPKIQQISEDYAYRTGQAPTKMDFLSSKLKKMDAAKKATKTTSAAPPPAKDPNGVTPAQFKVTPMLSSPEDQAAYAQELLDFKRKKAELHRETLEAKENIKETDALWHGISMIEAGAAEYANDAAIAYMSAGNALANMQQEQYKMGGSMDAHLAKGAETINMLNGLAEAIQAPIRGQQQLDAAFDTLGIENTAAQLQRVIVAHEEVRRAYGLNKVSAQDYYRAELALLKARLEAGQKLNQQEQQYYEWLKKKTGGVRAFEQAWKGFKNQVSTIMTDFSRSVVDILIPRDSAKKVDELSSRINSAFRSAFEGLSAQGFANPKKALEDVVASIQKAGSVAEANRVAVRHFGEAGPEIARMLRDGTMGAKELALAMGQATDSLRDHAEEAESKLSKIGQLWRELTRSIMRAAVEQIGEALAKFVIKHLKEIINSMDGILMRIPKIGKGLADVFGNTAGGVAGTVAGTAGDVMTGPMQIPQGPGGFPGGPMPGGGSPMSGMGKLMGGIDVVSGVVSAVAGVVTAIGTVRLEGTMNAVEWNTRKSSLHLEHMLTGPMNTFMPRIADIHNRLVEMQPWLSSINDHIVEAAHLGWGHSAAGGGGGDTYTIHIDGRLLQSSGNAGDLIAQGIEELKRRGVVTVKGQR